MDKCPNRAGANGPQNFSYSITFGLVARLVVLGTSPMYNGTTLQKVGYGHAQGKRPGQMDILYNFALMLSYMPTQYVSGSTWTRAHE